MFWVFSKSVNWIFTINWGSAELYSVMAQIRATFSSRILANAFLTRQVLNPGPKSSSIGCTILLMLRAKDVSVCSRATINTAVQQYTLLVAGSTWVPHPVLRSRSRSELAFFRWSRSRNFWRQLWIHPPPQKNWTILNSANYFKNLFYFLCNIDKSRLNKVSSNRKIWKQILNFAFTPGARADRKRTVSAVLPPLVPAWIWGICTCTCFNFNCFKYTEQYVQLTICIHP